MKTNCPDCVLAAVLLIAASSLSVLAHVEPSIGARLLSLAPEQNFRPEYGEMKELSGKSKIYIHSAASCKDARKRVIEEIENLTDTKWTLVPIRKPKTEVKMA